MIIEKRVNYNFKKSAYFGHQGLVLEYKDKKYFLFQTQLIFHVLIGLNYSKSW